MLRLWKNYFSIDFMRVSRVGCFLYLIRQMARRCAKLHWNISIEHKTTEQMVALKLTCIMRHCVWIIRSFVSNCGLTNIGAFLVHLSLIFRLFPSDVYHVFPQRSLELKDILEPIPMSQNRADLHFTAISLTAGTYYMIQVQCSHVMRCLPRN